MAVEANFGGGMQAGTQCADTRLHIIGEHVAGAVGAVDAVGAIAFHQLGLRQ